jgi:hypothetical protein
LAFDGLHNQREPRDRKFPPLKSQLARRLFLDGVDTVERLAKSLAMRLRNLDLQALRSFGLRLGDASVMLDLVASNIDARAIITRRRLRTLLRCRLSLASVNASVLTESKVSL